VCDSRTWVAGNWPEELLLTVTPAWEGDSLLLSLTLNDRFGNEDGGQLRWHHSDVRDVGKFTDVELPFP
jgi:hypothetical protein